ncbi:MAG: hypothetical protein HQM09_17280 [Candidatus Riflebacteria bacterium]|nr:hypothetical protein [Candidatus Riflebacteria bacterium]
MRILLLVITLCLIMPTFATAQAKQESVSAYRLFVNPGVGDWIELRAHSCYDSGFGTNNETRTVRYQIKAINDASKTISLECWSGGLVLGWDLHSAEFKNDASFVDERLLGKKITNIHSASEEKTIQGRTFKCVNISFSGFPQGMKAEWTFDLWISSEIKGLGLVAAQLEGSDSLDSNSVPISTELELVAYGSVSGKTWPVAKPDGAIPEEKE